MKIRSLRTTGILLALLVALALLLGGDAARAQTATALVSTIEQTATADPSFASSQAYAQSFTTGTDSVGYILSSIEVRLKWMGSDGANPPTMVLRSGSASGTKMADFSSPSGGISGGTANYTYTPTGNITLSTSTEYWVVLFSGQGAVWTRTNSDTEDSGASTGWSVSNDSSIGPSGGTLSSRTQTFKLRINGFVVPTLVSNLGKTATDDFLLLEYDYAQSFTTGGNAEGSWLSGIAVSLETIAGHLNPPTMTLHSGSGTGTKVADFTAPATLTAGTHDYTYTATTSVVLSASTEYWVVVEVGGSGAVTWKPTNSDSEDSGAASGWSIGNAAHRRLYDSTGSFSGGGITLAGKLSVQGTTINTKPPSLTHAMVDGTTLWLSYDEPLDTASTPAVARFSVRVDGGAAANPTAVAVTRYAVALTLASAVTEGQAVTVSYTVPGSNRIQDLGGLDASALTNRAVTNTVFPVLLSNFGQMEDDTNPISEAAQRFRTGSNPDGYILKSVELNSGSVLNADPANFPSLTLHSGSAAGPTVATFTTPGGVPDAVHDLEYTLATPVTLDPSTTYWVVTGPSTSGASWITTLVATTDSSTASGWTIPGKAQRKVGGTFTDYTTNVYYQLRVNGSLRDVTGPVLSSASVTGSTLSLTFDEDLDEGSVPAAAAFSVSIGGGAGASPANVLISGRVVTLRLASAVTEGRAVTVSYTVPVTNPIQDKLGNDAVAFSAQSVTNNTGCRAPTLVGGATQFWTGKVTVANNSSAAEQYGFGSGFGTLDDTTFDVGTYSFVIDGAHVEDHGRLVFSLGPIQDINTAQKRVFTLWICDTPLEFQEAGGPDSDHSYSWNLPGLDWSEETERTLYITLDSTPPTVVGAVANGTGLWIIFSEELGEADSLANADFAVTKGVSNTSAPLDSSAAPSITGRRVMLTLGSALTNSDTNVEVDYTKPTMGSDNEIVDRFGNEPASFADQAVDNQTGNDVPAVGAPTISVPNVYRVPAVLTAETDGIFDPNGKPSSFTYNWQRLSVDGILVEANAIGTGSTYTLTAADVGKRIKVQVSFTDNDSNPEGPLHSGASNVVRAAAECAEPTYVGGATQVWTGKVGVGYVAGNFGRSIFGYDNQPQYVPGSEITGSLSNTTFGSRTIDFLFYQTDQRTNPNTELNIAFRGGTTLSATDKKQLSLHSCDVSFPFNDAAEQSDSHTVNYKWTNPEIKWSDKAERTLYMSRDTAKPTVADASVNDKTLVITFNEELGEAASLANGAFAVTKGVSNTTVALDTGSAPAIDGKTATLTLNAGIVSTDTDVKVDYTKPGSGTDNKIVDLFGNLADSFTDRDVVNELADSDPPGLATLNAAVLAADGKTLTLTYDEPMKTSSVPDRSAFTVEATPAGGSEETLDIAATNGVNITSDTVVLTMAKPMAHNDGSVKVSYAKPVSNPLADLAGNEAPDFTDRSVTNNSAIPRISIRALHADASPLIAEPEYVITRSNTGSSDLEVELTVTETEDYFVKTSYEWTIDTSQTSYAYGTWPGSNTGRSNFNLSVNSINTDGTVTLTVADSDDYLPALAPDNTATVDIKLPILGPTVSVGHVYLPGTVTEGNSYDALFAFNTGTGVATPRHDFQIRALSAAGTAAINEDYSHTTRTLDIRGGDWFHIGNNRYHNNQAKLTVPTIEDSFYEGDETFLVELRKVPGNDSLVVIPTGAERATVTIEDDEILGVTEIKVTSTPSGGFYDVGETITFTLTFNGAVTVAGTPRFGFVIGDQTRQATYASGSDTVDLVFSHTVAAADGDDPDGISWAANSLNLPGGASIKFTHTEVNKRIDASLSHPAQAADPDQKVDTAKPALEAAEVDDATLTLTYSEDLDTTAPASTAFTVRVNGGTGTNPAVVSIADNVVTLTLGSGVVPAQTVSVSYAKPVSNPIKDLTGKEADGFTDRAVEHLVDLENFGAVPGDGRVRLEWTNPFDTTIRKYQHRHMSTSDSGWNPDWTDASGLDGSETTPMVALLITGLTNGIEYTFQLRPVYLQSGLEVPGNEAEVKSAPRGALLAPSGLTASSAGDGELALGWDNPNDVTITGYQYRYRNTGDTGWNPDWTSMPGSGATTVADTLTGLANNLRYTVELRALRGADRGPSASASETPRGPIARPANFTATSGDRRAVLNWDASNDDSIAYYMYRYRRSTEGSWNPDWTEIPDSGWTTATHTVTGLTNGLEYFFQVRAMRGSQPAQTGPDSALARARPLGPMPAPANLTATTDREDEIVLSWDAANDATITHYEYRAQGVGERLGPGLDLALLQRLAHDVGDHLCLHGQRAIRHRVASGPGA